MNNYVRIKTFGYISILAMFLVTIFAACKHDDGTSPPVQSNVTFRIRNRIDGQQIQYGTLMYTNEAGNLYSVTLLRYYLSNMTFLRSDGTGFKPVFNYELIDESDSASKVFTIENVPAGTYTKLRFNMGVDSVMNFSGPQEGDLDPVNGMLWDWFTGYLYFKHEGQFIDSTGTQNIVLYHYGSLKGLVTLEIPVLITIDGPPRTIELTFNLNKIYRSPNVIDFNGNNYHQSTGPNDANWLQLIKANFQGAFEVSAVY